MMGNKDRHFAPLPRDVSLEGMVPEDHFYRRLEATLDLSFVRELVRPLYAKGGRGLALIFAFDSLLQSLNLNHKP